MTSTGARVVVVGSANVDLVVETKRIPQGGETVLGGELKYTPGGKGANQACASARAGGTPTAMVAALGTDGLAGISLESMRTSNVDVSAVQRVDGPNGTALITVDEAGENAIVVAPGANAKLHVGPEQQQVVQQADVVLAQMEIPLEELIVAAKARRRGVPFILNAAPSQPIPYSLWEEIDLLVVNEHEAHDLVSFIKGAPEANRRGQDGPLHLAEVLLARVGSLIITLGSAGGLFIQRGEPPVQIPAFPAHAVDTVGAGDTFCGVLAAHIANGDSITTAMTYASAAAAIAVERVGAQDAIPTHDEVVARMNSEEH